MGVSVQGGLCPGGVSVQEEDPHPLTVKSGQYASYWNAFLFKNNTGANIWYLHVSTAYTGIESRVTCKYNYGTSSYIIEWCVNRDGSM